MTDHPVFAVSSYQTPYSAASYGANVPVPASNLPPNFQMNAAGNGMPMTPQQMQHLQNMQRMQPPNTTSTPTQPVPRASPFAHTNTPPDGSAKQSQFPPPPAPNQVSNSSQQGNTTIITPQTPNFPPGAQNAVGGNMTTPLSPGSASKEQERVTLLLDINRELLIEVMLVQATQADAKKEESEGTEEEKTEKSKKLQASQREYNEYVIVLLRIENYADPFHRCMRRLQANLAYLAAIADKSHKPGAQAPTHPAILTAPPLVPKAPSPTASPKKESADTIIPSEDRGERIETLKTQYKRLQEMFPDVDPKKEGQSAPAGSATKNAASQQQGGQLQGQGQQAPAGMDANAQQKMQNDQFRQKMMQQAQAQAQAQARAQAQAQGQQAR